MSTEDGPIVVFMPLRVIDTSVDGLREEGLVGLG